MDDRERLTHIKRLESNLRELREVKAVSANEPRFTEVYNEVCDILFQSDFFETIWDEPILLGVSQSFEERPPHVKVFGEKVALIKGRATKVKAINDLFFSVLDSNANEEEVFSKLTGISEIDAAVLPRFKAEGRLHDIRSDDVPPSDKIDACLSHFLEDLEVDFGLDWESLQHCLAALKDREGSGVVSALLVNIRADTGVVVPLHVLVQPGQGQVRHLVSGREDFKAAAERAMQCLKGDGFLRPADDVLYSLDITEAEYAGDSIALAAAIAMFSGARGVTIDPYTAFSGNINLSHGQWAITGVKGIPHKLQAARRYGCRRVFLPRENELDVGREDTNGLTIVFVNNLMEVLLKLQTPPERLQGEALYVRKMNSLRAACQARGWALSEPVPIQAGLQFLVSPPTPLELKLNIYYSGAQSPKTHQSQDFQGLLSELSRLEESTIPIQKVQRTFLIQEPDLRTQIAQALEKMGPTDRRQEQYCDYSYVFEDGNQKLVIKQFSSGKLQLQGMAGDLYGKALDVILSLYNLKHPQAKLVASDYLEVTTPEPLGTAQKGAREEVDVPLPYIGTDESGKGDYFGPMVVAGIWVDASILKQLESLGVRDSKMLSDKRCRELAGRIRGICKGRYEEVELTPERYNALYEEFKAERKNLNHLLAWGHARAMESLLERLACSHAVADQFGDEQYIKSRLMQRGKALELVQVPKGERYLAVAAASILARDCFLRRLEQIGRELKIEMPRGASDAVVGVAKTIVERTGPNGLRKAAKLHFRTTYLVLRQA